MASQEQLFSEFDLFSQCVIRVVIDNIFSNLTAVTSGVPQGTVLGHALFLIYINDIVDKTFR